MVTKAQLRAEKLWLAQFPTNPDWNALRRRYLKAYPSCAACGAIKRNNAVHHKLPVHLYPELELDLDNLITLCTTEANHHLDTGHLMSFKSYNPKVVEQAAGHLEDIRTRPKSRIDRYGEVIKKGGD